MRLTLALALLALASCSSDPAPPTDAGPADTGRVTDMGADTGPGDTGVDAPRDTTPTIDDPPVTDTGPVADASEDGATGDAGRVYPSGPYGSREGALFEPFALPGCNLSVGSDGWRFDQDDFWSSRATVLMLVAAWCGTCQREAAATEQELVQAYRGRGVRIVHVLVQDDQRRAANAETCAAWVARGGLTVPVLIDAQFVTQPFVPMSAFPGAVVIGADGRILARFHGNPTIAPIRAALDTALSTP
jgi:thiol-disulfide isomerase/thioredoxin